MMWTDDRCYERISDLWKKNIMEDGVIFQYPVTENAGGFYPWGFEQKNDSAADFSGWYGLIMELAAGERGLLTVEVRVSFADQEPLRYETAMAINEKRAVLEVPFRDFPLETVKENYWRFVTEITVRCEGQRAEVLSLTACRNRLVSVEFPVKGKSGEAGESVVYEGCLYNCTDRPVAVTLRQSFEGWEAMRARIDCASENDNDAADGGKKRDGTTNRNVCMKTSMEYRPAQMAGYGSVKEVIESGAAVAGCCGKGAADGENGCKKPLLIYLQPYGSCSVKIRMTVSSDMVPGGHENTLILFEARDGASTETQTVQFKTLRRLPHPYIYHDQAGWRERAELIKEYPCYQPKMQEILQTADAWEVQPPLPGRDYCYYTSEETNIMSAAYAYALTGERGYAEKIAAFFRYFTDEKEGYPARKRGCHQSYVQEGHFFQHLAISCDIIADSGVLTEEESAAVEKCFRIYMNILDIHIRSGFVSNWLVSEIQGALYCALALQDMNLALRFVFGNGGLVEQFRHGIFNDGWWHECSVGYNTWVSSMMIHMARALLPFGYDLRNTRFQIPWNKEVSASYPGRKVKVLSGMYNQKWGGNHKNYICIKDMFDAVVPFLDDRGVLFGIADSDEKKLDGVHFGSTYDLAYAYYRDESYLPIILRCEPDPIFGNPEIDALRNTPEGNRLAVPSKYESAHADNIGIAMLRSQTGGREKREQIQAVLRYGSHGGAHGHFDICSLLSVMRYGRSLFNPEHCWWGYAHFMYKFYVQCSLTKNMMVVDDKMQVPADSRLILFQKEEGVQAAGVEVVTKWAYPPYGGMVYYQDGQENTREALRERCKMNGCCLPIVEGEEPVYGEMSDYTEDILQRRVMAVTDDYIVLFDYLKGEKEHIFDNLMQIKGFRGIEGEAVTRTGHTEQMNDNPVSDAQFITDCSWYQAKGVTRARFETVFTEEHAGARKTCDRSNYNEPGLLKTDVYTVWPPQTEQMVGRVAVYDGWAADQDGYTVPLEYRIEADGREIAQGAFDGWILGRDSVHADISGIEELMFAVKQGCRHNEQGQEVRTPQCIFWGEMTLTFEDGSRMDIGELLKGYYETKSGITDDRKDIFFTKVGDEDAVGEDIQDEVESREKTGNESGKSGAETVNTENSEYSSGIIFCNIDKGQGIGKDYQNGRVTIVGTEYPNAIPFSPVDHNTEGKMTISLFKLLLPEQKAVALDACIGVDAFPGDEDQKRKTHAVRTKGTSARFVTVIEPYEAEPVVSSVSAQGPDEVTVTLRDGRVQKVTIDGMEEKKCMITVKNL